MLRRSAGGHMADGIAAKQRSKSKGISVNQTSVFGAEAFIAAQKRVLDFQRNALDRGFEVLTRLQEQQREISGQVLEQIPNLPDEARGISDAWWQARISGRESLKSAVDRSFDLADGYYQRLAERAG